MKILAGDIKSPLEIPSSKSYANRALILAVLSKRKIKIKKLPLALDVKEMVCVLEQLNLIEVINEEEIVCGKNIFDLSYQKNTEELYLGEGGTTIRFLLPLLALTKNSYKIKIHPSFKKRPYKDLLNLLKSLGAEVSLLDAEDELCYLKGPIVLDKVVVNAKVTTQVASAFLLLQSCLNFELEIEGVTTSEAYLEMTKKVIHDFKSRDEYIVPVDMSCASYFIALAVLKNSTVFKNIFHKDIYQADSYLLDMLEELGVNYHFGSYGLSVEKINVLKPFSVSVGECLDLAPTLAFIASFAQGRSELKKIHNLQYKESNRIQAIVGVLQAFGISYELKEDSLYIDGCKNISIDTPRSLEVVWDHRIVMMASLFFKMGLSGGEINPQAAVKKSFPNFFDLINNIDTVI